ncbi:hypothetical protein ACIRO3_33235 [Streptomyces sp. NPDC102278]
MSLRWPACRGATGESVVFEEPGGGRLAQPGLHTLAVLKVLD